MKFEGMINPPMRVMWAGWESDTYRLQDQGWDISMDQNIDGRYMQVAFRHRGCRMHMIGHRISDFEMREYKSRPRYGLGDAPNLPPIMIACVGSDIDIVRYDNPGMDITRFRSIDAAPAFISQEIKSLEDWNIFGAPLVRTNEIIVEPASVSKLMEQILKFQSPRQKEIRQNQRRRDGRELPDQRNFHAQIMSIAS